MQHAERSGWLCVCGGVSIHLVLGCLYLWGNITTAVTSHLRIYDDSITYQDTLLVFATALGVQGCTMLLGGLVERRYGARTTVLAGGYTLTLGTFLSATATSLTEILFYDGVMFGVGMQKWRSGGFVSKRLCMDTLFFVLASLDSAFF